MTRYQWRLMWLMLGGALLLAATYTHGTAQNYLERGGLFDVLALLWWEWAKDK